MNTTQPLKVAVLLICYRRIESTLKILEIVKHWGHEIVISVDGPQKAHEVAVASLIAELVSFREMNENTRLLVRPKNLGLAFNVTRSIDEVLVDNDAIIVLEDDCIPDPTAGRYFTELLEYFKDDLRIFSVSGSAFLAQDETPVTMRRFSYLFSKYPHVWGWATWKDRWSQYDLKTPDLESFVNDHPSLCLYSRHWIEKEFWIQTLRGYRSLAAPQSWDFQWSFTHFKNSGLCIIPTANLISNVGDVCGTHVADVLPHNRISNSTAFPISHYPFVVPSIDYDNKVFLNNYNGRKMVRNAWPGKRMLKNIVIMARKFFG